MTEQQAREKAVSKIREWVGYSEKNGKYQKILDLYNSQSPLPSGYRMKTSDAWCAATVSAVGVALGWTDIILPECSCNRMIKLYQAAGRWEENDAYVPQIGDLVMYDWQDSGVGDNKGEADHVGMVTLVNGNSLTIIEGNKNQAVSGSDGVESRTLFVNGKYIRGYCLPDYAKKADKTGASSTTSSAVSSKTANKTVQVSCEELQSGCKGESVKTLQMLLNWRLSYKLDVDGSFGSKTKTAVAAFQKRFPACGSADGIVGSKTWGVLIGG